MNRPPVIDYKLIDVPEFGYFLTDKPLPRGELLVKSQRPSPGTTSAPTSPPKRSIPTATTGPVT